MALLLKEPMQPVAAYADRLVLHPVRTIVLSFATLALIGAVLLSLPLATQSGAPTRFLDALFTAISALCVTGLTVVDTGSHWSLFGLIVILTLIQVGALGLMAVATLLGALFWGRLSIAQHRRTSHEISAFSHDGDMRRALALIMKIALAAQALLAVVLALRFYASYDLAPMTAIGHGLFHGIAAYTNAGFALWPDSLVRFSHDPLILLSVGLAIFVGGIGFPVLWDIAHQRWRRARWSLHSQVTVAGSLVLLLVGWLGTMLFEWHNALEDFTVGERVLNALFYSLATRSGGFNTFALNALEEPTLVLSTALMFVGAGVASTGGGIKVATFMVLLLILRSELRGDRDVSVFGRRISHAAQRRAIAIVFLGLLMVISATLALSLITHLPMRDLTFEAVSAFGTVGLSTGITAALPDSGKAIIMALMFAGRVGPVTLGAALIIRYRQQNYRFPQEDPIIG